MIANKIAFENGEFKKRSVLINVDKLPLHQQIKVKRCAEGMNQAQLCKVLEIPDRAFLSRVESGKVGIPEHLVERVNKYLYEETYVNGELQA
ncbi:helix-turn-helix domain-containing protein [Bacillus toyonensis]|uniref:helix-turn-helix domain-containing protein n=1 Tax=Bacillus toyonensis TaxID=155322 RepID=UPI00157141D5|nr:helix-turn-helix transcriptional regulator [Bacillus toyonensis]NSL68294.1 helix-turn-helix transcriptional regulator [Bacillus toyonensis]